MVINSLKQAKAKLSKVRVVDIDELNMAENQNSRENTAPNFQLVSLIVNPAFQPYKIVEATQNVVDIIKGTRAMQSLQYSAKTVFKAFVLNTVVYTYIAYMDAALQFTSLQAFNNDSIMRDLVKLRFNINDAAIDNLLNNREEYQNMVEKAKAAVKSKLVKVGHVEALLKDLIYKMRYDDPAQYTTRILYELDLLIPQDDVNTFLAKALTAGFGRVIKTFGVANTAFSDAAKWFDTYNDTPAKWYDVIEKLTASTFIDSEYHAFRTDYFASYTTSALWDLTLDKIGDYYSESDSAVLANAAVAPVAFAKDANEPAGKQIRGEYFFEDTFIATIDNATIDAIFAFNSPTLTMEVDQGDFTMSSLTIPNANGQFKDLTILSTDSDKVAQKCNVVVNLKKSNLAKDMELSMIAATKPTNLEVDNGNVKVGYFTITFTPALYLITAYTYMWSSHFKDGSLKFTKSDQSYSAPLITNTAGGNAGEGQISVYAGVSDQPQIVRVRYSNSNYVYDTLSELYDLYEITPASIADAQRSVQYAFISTELVLANERVENFAEILDMTAKN